MNGLEGKQEWQSQQLKSPVMRKELNILRDIPKIIKFKATNSLRVSCLFCIFKHSPQKRFDGQNGGN